MSSRPEYENAGGSLFSLAQYDPGYHTARAKVEWSCGVAWIEVIVRLLCSSLRSGGSYGALLTRVYGCVGVTCSKIKPEALKHRSAVPRLIRSCTVRDG